MSNPALNSKAFRSTPWFNDPALRDLVDAMPIVIFARAVRSALRATQRSRASLRVVTSN